MNLKEYLVESLGEECVEVAQRCSKANKFGHLEIQPGQFKTNAERIVDEYVQVLAIADMLEEHGIISVPTGEDLERMKNDKKERVLRFLEYSKSLGVVQGEV